MNRTFLVASKIRPTHLNRDFVDKLPIDEDKAILIFNLTFDDIF